MLRSFDPNLPLSRLPPRVGDNNVDIAHLLDFVTQLYHPQLPNSFYIQLQFLMGAFVLPFILGSFVIIRRFIKGQAWFLKFWHVGGGTFVIPNAIMAFLGCQFIFAICCFIYFPITIRFYRDHAFQNHYFLWKALIWIPLFDGAWWNAFGMLSAFPEALTQKSRSGMQRRLILSPCAFNFTCWIMPLVHLASALPPTILASDQHNSALDNFVVWQKAVQLSQQNKLTDANYALLQSRALDLWLSVTRAYWYFNIAMACWSIWAVICFAVYVPIGAHTLLRMKARLKSGPTKEVKLPVINIEVSESDTGDAWTKSGSFLTIPRIDEGFSTTSRVFPSTKDPTPSSATPSSKNETTEQRRITVLKKVYVNLQVQFHGIWVAVVCFITSSSIYSAQAYESARRNDIAPLQIAGNLSAAWAIVVFAYLTILAIFWRAFDPALSIDVPEGDLEAPRAMLSAFKDHASAWCRSNSLVPSLRHRSSGTSSYDDGNSRWGTSAPIRLESFLDLQRTMTRSALGDTKHRKATSLDMECQQVQFRMPGLLGVKRSNSVKVSTTQPTEEPTAPPVMYFATPFGKVPGARSGFVQEQSSHKAEL